MWRNWQHRHRSAPGGRFSEVRMAQRSKFGEANSEQLISGTARVTRSLNNQLKLILYADVAELADALDSGSSESNFMWVQVPSSAPRLSNRKIAEFFSFLQKLSLIKRVFFPNAVIAFNSVTRYYLIRSALINIFMR